jgi:hypothetical protein
MGASRVARARPLSSAAAWWTRSNGVPSPSGAIAMTEWVRPPGGQLEGDPATEGVPGDVELQLSP